MMRSMQLIVMFTHRKYHGIVFGWAISRRERKREKKNEKNVWIENERKKKKTTWKMRLYKTRNRMVNAQ